MISFSPLFSSSTRSRGCRGSWNCWLSFSSSSSSSLWNRASTPTHFNHGPDHPYDCATFVHLPCRSLAIPASSISTTLAPTGIQERQVGDQQVNQKTNDTALDGIIEELKVQSTLTGKFTDWIQAIQQATIVHLGPTEEWQEDETKIQVKRLGEKDLFDGTMREHLQNEEPHEYGEKDEQNESPYEDEEEDEDEQNEDEDEDEENDEPHKYEQSLDVIKLPVPIPGQKMEVAPQFLFIRPDEYALFMCFGITEWCILTGNPGISKSWFQWKFILLCYRQDLLKQLWLEKTQEKAAKKIKVSGPQEEKKKSSLKQSEPFIPDLIVRTVGGQESLLFFVNQPNKEVSYIKHDPRDLKRFTNEKSTILWEPGASTNPVYYQDTISRMIATVPPNEELFDEFWKQTICKMFYMPCPSELQLRLMGQVLKSLGNDCPTDEEIRNRVNNYGPFIPVALNWDKDKLNSFHVMRQHEMARISVTDKILSYNLLSPMHIMRRGDGVISGLSHCLVRYQIRRNSTAGDGGYCVPYYELNSDEVHSFIRSKIRKIVGRT